MADKMYFWYERSMLAKWCPNKGPNKPNNNLNKTLKFTTPVELEEGEEKLSFAKLQRIYPAPSEEST